MLPLIAVPPEVSMDEREKARAKILGVLIKDARVHARRSIDECARALGISPEEMSEAERGEYIVSLPQLEVLAVYLDVPMAHFWGTHTLDGPEEADYSMLLHLRNKMVGGLMQQARLEADVTLDEMADQLDVDEEQMRRYEQGLEPISFLQLEKAAQFLDVNINYFVEDEHGPLAQHEAAHKRQRHFKELPVELQEFVAKPVNINYLQTAKRLSEMDTEQLRNLAAGLLEITY
jgi:transcriptional regulator with XRE-family HTH domain